MSLDIAKANLQQIIRDTVNVLGAELCEVIAVDVTNLTIDCVGQSTLKVYYKVPLVTTKTENVSIVAIPDVDSKVIIVHIDRFNSYVALTGKLTQLYFTSPQMISTITDLFQITDEDANVDFQISPDGMKLVVADQSLKDAVTDLKTAIGQLTVSTPAGASSTPVNISNINSAFDKILSVLQ